MFFFRLIDETFKFKFKYVTVSDFFYIINDVIYDDILILFPVFVFYMK